MSSAETIEHGQYPIIDENGRPDVTDSYALYSALLYRQAGLSLIPVAPDHDEGPYLDKARKQITDIPGLRCWFGNPLAGPSDIGIVCGAVSELEIISFCDPETFAAWKQSLIRRAPGLFESIVWVATPELKVQGYFRCSNAEKSQTLAQWLIPRGPRRSRTMKRIEVIGEGGYGVVTATPPDQPRRGKSCRYLTGRKLTSTAKVTDEQRALLFDVARSFDELAEYD